MSRCVVVGSGAREHALAWALSSVADVVVTPGNAGIAAHGLSCVATPATSLEADLFVIGPESPLVDGVADQLRAQGKCVFGPGADGARLEGSKAYLKEFLDAAHVPTARYGTFRDVGAATTYLDSLEPPYVIKTDGLAAGKGVLVTSDVAVAHADVREKLSGRAFGDAGRTVVIEEGLKGYECSLHVLCDGTDVVALTSAQDFKRVGDHDEGPNTGGMGAYAPMPDDRDLVDEALATIVQPTLKELRRRGIDYRGVLYAGLMVTPEGPKLLEYNVRFGDPETQVLAALYRDQLAQLLGGVARGELVRPSAVTGAAVTVVLAAQGYPQSPRSGDVITGLGPDGQLAEALDDVVVFHAGTSTDRDGRFLTSGGRVLSVTARAKDVARARALAYEAASRVSFRGLVRREDIARGAARQ